MEGGIYWKHKMNHLIKVTRIITTLLFNIRQNWPKYTSNLILKENDDGRKRHGCGSLLSDIVAEFRNIRSLQYLMLQIIVIPLYNE